MDQPLYLEIKLKLKDMILNMNTNSSIASERDLALEFDVSRMTVRKALNELVEEGVLYRDKNKGTFISEKKLTKKNTALEHIRSYDEVILLHLNVKKMEEISKIFEVSDEETFIRVVYKNSLDDNVISLEEMYMMYDRVEPKSRGDLDKLIKFATDNEDTKIYMSFYPIMVPIKYANIMGIKMNQPIIMIEYKIYGKNGKLHSLIKSYINPSYRKIEII